MSWRRRLLLLALFAAVFTVALAGSIWWIARGEPEWYTRAPMDPAVMEAAADRAEKQVQRTLSWAQDQQAYAASSAIGAPSTHPARSIEISFTQDELNGFFHKWDSTFGWSQAYSQYISQPQIALRDGRLIFAATVNNLGSVLSVELLPRLEVGRLRLTIGRVLAGNLPLPATLSDGYRDRAESAVKAKMAEWRAGAEIGPKGGANLDAVAAAMGDLLVDTLEDRPAAPVLFLPYAMQSRPKSLPVKLIDLRIVDRTITLTVEPLDPTGRQKLLSEIRAGKEEMSGT